VRVVEALVLAVFAGGDDIDALTWARFAQTPQTPGSSSRRC
jgi:hypothetical protein